MKWLKEHIVLVGWIFSLLTFLHFAVRVHFDWHIYLDGVSSWLSVSNDSFFLPFWTGITNVGDVMIFAFLVIMFIFIFVYVYKDRVAAILLPAAILIGQLCNLALKDFFNRPRPEWNTIVFADGLSFPSGHSMMSCILWSFVCFVLYQYQTKKWNRQFLIIAPILLIGGIGVSRVVLGAHYFSDVIGGFAAGAILIIPVIVLYQRLHQRYEESWPIPFVRVHQREN